MITMTFIPHPDRFTSGVRVVMLKGRHKDGLLVERSIVRVSYSEAHFMPVIEELSRMAKPGERIYASAGERNAQKAVREFKRRQLDADYDYSTTDFYKSLDKTWCSCLSSPFCQEEKLWLFDCDNEEQLNTAELWIAKVYRMPLPPYKYKSKSGTHIVVCPFDKSKVDAAAQRLIKDNAIMLWAF